MPAIITIAGIFKSYKLQMLLSDNNFFAYGMVAVY